MLLVSGVVSVDAIERVLSGGGEGEAEETSKLPPTLKGQRPPLAEATLNSRFNRS